MNFYHARSLSVLAMTAALVAAPLAASAAPGMPDEGGPRHHQKGGPDFGHHGPDFGRFGGDHGRFGGAPGLHALNLSQDQQDQIFKIRHDQEQAFYDGKKALRAAHASLRDIGRADTFDEAKARQAADALGQAQSRMALLRVQTDAQIRAVLTPEQRPLLRTPSPAPDPPRCGAGPP